MPYIPAVNLGCSFHCALAILINEKPGKSISNAIIDLEIHMQNEDLNVTMIYACAVPS